MSGSQNEFDEVIRVPLAVSSGLGDVGQAVEPEDGEGEVGQGGQDVGGLADADAAGVLAEGGVADPVDGVLYLPVVLDVLGDGFGAGFGDR